MRKMLAFMIAFGLMAGTASAWDKPTKDRSKDGKSTMTTDDYTKQKESKDKAAKKDKKKKKKKAAKKADW